MISSYLLFLSVLGIAAAALSLEDILKLDPATLLKAPTVSDLEKRRLIDCLDNRNTAAICPEIPAPDALKKFRDLLIKTKQASENKGLIGGLLSGVGSLLSGDGVTTVLTEASKNADALIKLFDTVKSMFVKETAGLPEDPFQDISDYLKRKHAHETRYDLVGAVKTRGKLREHYASTNDDILHKYSSNYDILNPHVQLIGVVRTLLEIYS